MRSLWTLILLLTAVSRAGAYGERGTFYYLDYPESVRRPGLLASMILPQGQRARVFFHYRNSTHRVQRFWFRTTGPMLHVRWACATDWIPGHAGSAAARSFFSRPADAGPRLVSILCLVKPRMVVSGIVDGTPVADLRVLCRMGKGRPIYASRAEVAQHILWRFVVALNSHHRVERLRIGEKRKGHINGDYGSTIQVRALAPWGSLLRVVISPRGGDIRFVYSHNGVVHLKPGCRAYRRYELYTIRVTGTDVLEIIPVGGYSYPVEVSYYLVKAHVPRHRRHGRHPRHNR